MGLRVLTPLVSTLNGIVRNRDESALSGSILPNVLGQSKQHTRSFAMGFAAYAVLACAVLIRPK
jgi:hypothetical protein